MISRPKTYLAVLLILTMLPFSTIAQRLVEPTSGSKILLPAILESVPEKGALHKMDFEHRARDASEWGVKAVEPDNTVSLSEAINDIAANGGGVLNLPAGVVNVSKVPLVTGVYLRGQGKGVTTIRKMDYSNTANLMADENASLFGTTPSDPVSVGTHDFGVSDLTIDGNMAKNVTAPGNTCFQFWGYRETVINTAINNCPGSAWRSEWTDGLTSMEGFVDNLTIDTCSYNGMEFGGPHDSRNENVIVKDCGIAASNTYYGVRVYGTATSGAIGMAEWENIHTWVSTLPMSGYKYGLFVDTYGGANVLHSQIEGAISAALRIQGYDAGSKIADSALFSVTRGPLASICSAQNDISFAGTNIEMKRPVGIVFDNTKDCNPAANNISIINENLIGGPIDFTNSNGQNQVKIRGYQASGPVVIGNFFNENILDYSVSNKGSLQFASGVQMLNSTSRITVSGFCDSPTISTSNTAGFLVNVGGSCTSSSGVVNLPTTATVWQCTAISLPAGGATSVRQIAGTETSVTLEKFSPATGSILNFLSNEHLAVSCRGF